MGKTDYAALLEELDKAIEMDQIYVARDILIDLDKAEHKGNLLVQKYFAEHEESLDATRKNIDKVTELLATLRSETSWTKCNEKKDVVVYFQKTEDSPLLMTKVETFFPGQTHELPKLFVKLVSLFNETDLLPRWFPRNVMKSADMLKQVTKFSKIVNPKVGLPPPVNFIIGPRECVIIGKGFDMSERSSVVITVTTLKPKDEAYGMTVPDLTKGYTQMFLECAFYFELVETGIKFRLMQLVDLNSPIIPTPLMNWLAKGQLPFEYMKNLKKRIDNFDGSIWEERVKQSPHIYVEVEKRLLNFLEKERNFIARPLKDTVSVNEFDGASAADDNLSVGMSEKGGKSSKKKNGLSRRLSQTFEKITNRTSSKRTSQKKTRSGSRMSRTLSLSNSRRSKSFTFKKKGLNEVAVYDDVLVDDTGIVQAEKQPESLLEWVIFIQNKITEYYQLAKNLLEDYAPFLFKEKEKDE